MGSMKSSDRPLALLSSIGPGSILLAVALGAVILGGLTLVWVAVDGGVRPKGASAAQRVGAAGDIRRCRQALIAGGKNSAT